MQPIEIHLPDTTTLEGMKDALGRILSALATGQIAPGEAQSLSALIEHQRKVIETSELAARIDKLESEMTARSLFFIVGHLFVATSGFLSAGNFVGA